MVSGSRILNYSDPYEYQQAIRGAELEVIVPEKGRFKAELIQVEFSHLWLTRGRENLSRIFHGAVSKDRFVIGFLADASQQPIQHCGMSVSPGEIIVNDRYEMHRRTEGPCYWGAMSLTSEDMLAAGMAVADCELSVPSVTQIIRPNPQLMSRLLKLHAQVGELAKTSPQELDCPDVVRSLEDELVSIMVRALADGQRTALSSGAANHLTIMRRFEEFLASHCDEPAYLTEICAATGTSERTLRVCCEDHLGMSPIRYLWLRRMHLAHHALACTDPATATVTDIATRFGFWELGRFSVEYRAQFGEPPSMTLRRRPINAADISK